MKFSDYHQQDVDNMHDLMIPVSNTDGQGQVDHTTGLKRRCHTWAQAIFKDHEKALIEKIDKWRDGVILGAVAWLTSIPILEAYYKEFQQIYALSEPLDWETEWAAPELRIGT